ncbi:Late embryogenesis abundant (LEA) hydroxyproline-rich glycoprotein family [Trifolium repens]|nr:Late embryogenesis abundant (LEA) hydroxyproline-rich glycoprotein family [Trifolium repens]
MEEKKHQGVKWSWTSAIIGAASAIAATSILSAKPKDPTFHLISINFTSLKPSLPVLDAEVLLTVHVTNPNIAPINYTSTTMSIFYEGSLLGSAPVQAGSQPPRSCQLLRLPARLKASQLAQHVKRVVADVAKREMVLDAAVDIAGTARVLWWDHNFKVRVHSHVTVDPVFLDVIDQQNTTQLQLFASDDESKGEDNIEAEEAEE